MTISCWSGRWREISAGWQFPQGVKSPPAPAIGKTPPAGDL